jgi:hypothetical protein
VSRARTAENEKGRYNMIVKPGIYPEISSAAYFADPCPTPSFTQSIGKILLENSPLHAWYEHPRLNPDYVSDDPTKFDVGNVAHKLLLGRGKEIVVIEEHDDWRTKAAKEAREAALAEGKHAVLGKHFALASRMVDAAGKQLELMPKPANDLFRNGNSEVCLAWQEDGFWFRQLVDWFSDNYLLFADLKTTDMSVAPHMLGRKMQSDNWPMQAAMCERGLRALGLATPRFFFVAQETWQPYALTVAELTEGHIERGRMQLDFAIEIWKSCMKHNLFPSYPREIIVPEYPGWADAEWDDRKMQLEDRKMITEIV